MSHDSTLYPARYTIQRKDGDRWAKVGNGANVTAPLTKRKLFLAAEAARLGVAAEFRVWDRVDGCEIIEVPGVGEP